MRHRRRGPYQVQAAIAALHARAAKAEDTDWRRSTCSTARSS
jgi:RNA polymerase sigma-70 factor (ECF subfamily)